ncbi:MAG: SLBB domain-containing protein, partial [Candidatus Latescibacteria bacterium]|nr:SLBB domain-containing protein [Candidatus Latescibacterota bacterium]
MIRLKRPVRLWQVCEIDIGLVLEKRTVVSFIEGFGKMLRLIPLLLLLAFVGCQSGEPVTISGAVHHAGSFDYRAGRKVADYIREAGGYTDEAVITDTYLVRVALDSIDEEKIKSVRVAVTDSSGVLPGDVIVVPGQVYAVRLDTVRTIQNVRLETKDEILKIDRGVIVPGWTPRGVVVAMLIGRGKVFEVSDTTTAVSGFHYLYVHMHPEEYNKVQRFAGDVVDSLEALEDTHAVHGWLFANRDYQDMGAAEIPPAGYFEVLQGIWLSPRNASMPGEGMRKRRFDDGRI